ncbi:tetratricopeptide repeat protein [Streptomyces sp. NPDC005573]|uniref:tetratricopeptide repeat protein n=1 Tax=Streptomyces sp. NPDC005573 TaxID=3156890 RepID=UPI0033A8D8A8
MFGQAGALTDAERTVARVWNITLDHITTGQPAAVDLLRSLAWYAPDAIPAALAVLPDASGIGTNQALGLLTAYSLITPDPATGTISVHRLVQALTRTPDPTNPHRTPDLIDRARILGADHPDTLATRNNLAGAYQDTGDPARAIPLLAQTLDDSVRILGPDHPSTITTRNNLAHIHREAGNLDEAISLFRESLDLCVERFGADHPLAGRTRSAYAKAWQKRAVVGSKMEFGQAPQRRSRP